MSNSIFIIILCVHLYVIFCLTPLIWHGGWVLTWSVLLCIFLSITSLLSCRRILRWLYTLCNKHLVSFCWFLLSKFGRGSINRSITYKMYKISIGWRKVLSELRQIFFYYNVIVADFLFYPTPLPRYHGVISMI